MNKFKKLFSISLTLLMLFVLFKFNSTSAESEKVFSDNGKVSWTLTDEKTTNINGMKHTLAHGYTNDNIPTNKQQVNVFEMKTDGAYSKIVNWAIASGNSGYRRATLADIAKDYELNHPGWIVLGGINADQYAMTENYGGSGVPVYPQPYYPVSIDGERRFVTGLFGTTSNFVGLTNNGENNPFIYESSIDGYYLYIYNENNELIDKVKIEGLNKDASTSGTTVWMAYQKLHSDKTGTHIEPSVSGNNLFVVDNAELAYISQAPEYRGLDFAGFGKGVVTNETTSHTVKEGQIVVQTNDPKVISYISGKQNIKIVVQGNYTNDNLNNVECSAGFHSAQRLNDKDVETTASYDTQSYSRSIFGRKADGTYALVTIDLKSLEFKGTTQDESNAILKSYGIVEAYQQDGGGSVTAVLRNEIGTFDTVNTVKDGSVRTIFNGLFFVVRDPGFTLHPLYNTRNSIKVKLVENDNTQYIKNAKVTVDGKTYDMDGNELVIDGLKENTEYEVIYTFDMLDEKTKEYKTVSYSSRTITKSFQMPSSGFKFTNVNKNEVTITRSNNNKSSWFKNIQVMINNETYNMGSDYELKVEGLIENTKYTVEFTYDVLEPDTGNIYHGKETKTVTTLSYSLPKIVKFEIYRQTNSKITFSYEYSDDDGVVEYANILCNGSKTQLTSKRGTIAISDLDFEHNEYTFQLQIAYDPGAAFLEQILSDKIIVGKNVETPEVIKHNITWDCDGGVLEDAPSDYVEGEGLKELPIPTKEGYIFLGWFNGEEKVEKIDIESSTDILLKAKWQEVEQNNDVNQDKVPPVENGSKGCGCGKNSAIIIMLSLALSSVLIIFRKRK